MGEARKYLVEESDFDRRAREANEQDEANRERYGKEGGQALRRLGAILRGEKPSRDADYEPVSRSENRGRARKQPAIIGTRG
jgi:cytochrome c556